MKLKNIISFLVTLALIIAFLYVVFMFLDSDMAKAIVSTFLTIATSVIGFYIGYQTNKKKEEK